MHVQDLDSIRLLKLCGTDQANYDAWQELFSRFSGTIKRFMARSCQRARKKYHYLASQISLIPAQEVDDLSQQLWLRLIEREGLLLKRFSGITEEDFCAYLAVLARFIAENHYRDLGRKKRPCIEHSLDHLADMEVQEHLAMERMEVQTSGNMEEDLFKKEIIGWLYATARSRYSGLDNADRAVIIFELYFFQGLTADEIARRQGIKLSRRGVTKVVSTLRRYLTQQAKAHGLNLAHNGYR